MINNNIRKEGLYLGFYETQYDVWNVYPNPLNGSFMTVGKTLSVWMFVDGRWQNTAKGGGGSADTTELEEAIATIQTELQSLSQSVESKVEKTALTNALNQLNHKDSLLTLSIGSLSSLATANKTNLVGAINETYAAIGSGGTGSAITVTAKDTEAFAKVYEIKQGGVLVGTIDIPQDLVTNGGYYDNNTQEIVIVLVNDEQIRIPASDLVDIYKGGDLMSISISIDDDNTIYASIKNEGVKEWHLENNCVSIGKLSTEVQEMLGKATTSVQTVEIANTECISNISWGTELIFDASMIDYKFAQLQKKQDALTAGEGIAISNNVISCTLDTSLYKVVLDLPTVGEENKLYLIESDEKGTQNIYTEYAYINGAWEILGEYRASINLEPYALKSSLPTKVSQLQNDANYLTSKDIPESETYVLNFTIKDGVNTGAYDATEYANLRQAIEKGKLIIVGGAVTRVTADSQAMAADYVVIRYSTPRISEDNKSVTISFYELKFSATEYTSKAIHKTIG